MDNEVDQRDWLARVLGKHPSLTIAAVAIAAVVLVFALARPVRPSMHDLEIKCYFRDAQGLRPGARVRLGGVDVGSVTGIRARPELRDHPAEVIMLLQTPYELKIPSDSVVSLETAGLLGEVFPEINVRDASGPPLPSGGVLATRESATATDWLKCLANVAAHKPCNLDATAEPANKGSTPGPERK